MEAKRGESRNQNDNHTMAKQFPSSFEGYTHKIAFFQFLLFAFVHMCECVTYSKLLLRHLSLSAVVNITFDS